MSKKTYTFDQQSVIDFPHHARFSTGITKLLVEAGAGAGKTGTLTARVCKHIQSGMDPSRLNVVTFTRAAAQEIQMRVSHALQEQFDTIESAQIMQKCVITTIDSFFHHLLFHCYELWFEKNHPKLLYKPPTLISEAEAKDSLNLKIESTLRTIWKTLPDPRVFLDFLVCGGIAQKINVHGEPEFSDIRQHICGTLLSEDFCDPRVEKVMFAAAEVHPFAPSFLQDLRKIARGAYEERILSGRITHSDRTLFLYETLSKQPDFPLPFQPLELIVDEYQDTSSLQHEVLSLIVQNTKARWVVVGDPKQSIYRFRNASVEIFSQLRKAEDWAHVELLENFRSQPELLNQINFLSALTFRTKPSYLRETSVQNHVLTQKALERQVHFKELQSNLTSDDSAEVHWIAASTKDHERKKEILLTEVELQNLALQLKKIREQYTSWSACVVLAEYNKQCEWIARGLQKYGIPASVQQSRRRSKLDFSYHAFEVGALLWKSLHEDLKSHELFSLLTSSLMQESWEDVQPHFFSKPPFGYEKKLSQLLKNAREVAINLNALAAWQWLRFKCLEVFSPPQRDVALQTLLWMEPLALDLQQRFETDEFSPPPRNKREWWNQVTLFQRSPHADACVVRTVHSAKGLEWPVVAFWPSKSTAFRSPHFLNVNFAHQQWIKWELRQASTLSLFPKMENHEFTDQEQLTWKEFGKDKTKWACDIAEDLQEVFERQRVFYTAFTRASEKLLLCLPCDNRSYQSLRDRIGDVKLDEEDLLQKTKRNSFEDMIFTQALDTLFNFRKKEDGSNKVTKHVFHNHTDLLDIGNRLPEENEIDLKVNQPTFLNSNPAFDLLNYVKNINQKIKVTKNDTPSSNVEDFSGENAIIDKKDFGIRLHAELEHTQQVSTRKTHPIFLQLKSRAIETFHEFEVWFPSVKIENFGASLLPPGRRILDFWCVLPLADFEACLGERERQEWEMFGLKTDQIACVVDFKSGNPALEHTQQVQEYIEILKKYCARHFPSASVVGALCYFIADKKADFRVVFGS